MTQLAARDKIKLSSEHSNMKPSEKSRTLVQYHHKCSTLGQQDLGTADKRRETAAENKRQVESGALWPVFSDCDKA